jgi:hypothetical protein
MRAFHGPDQFIQFYLDRLRIAVLGILDEENHKEGDDCRAGIDH